MKDILTGMRHLVEKSIMHRDLKPENIFIDNNNFKIADFGKFFYYFEFLKIFILILGFSMIYKPNEK